MRTARIGRVLHNDPGLGVARHADAGYPSSIALLPGARFRVPGFEVAPDSGKKTA